MSVQHLVLMALLWLALPILVLLHLCGHLSPFFPCPLETGMFHSSVHVSLLFARCSLNLGDFSQAHNIDTSYLSDSQLNWQIVLSERHCAKY